jgi:hypothetical protein
MKKPNRKQLELQIDRLWAKRIRERDTTCRSCNSDAPGLSAHHIRVRQHTATKFDVQNGILLCRSCHSLQKFRPEKFHDMIIDIIGQPEYDRLREKSKVVVKLNVQDLIEIKEYLK